MIVETSGDLLTADVDAIVNTVNCVGVMGKGIALQVKRRYPAVFDAYARECKRGNVQIGRMLPVPTNELTGPAWVINFPTKTHWRAPSRLSYISEGLFDLLRVVKELDLHAIAVPPLGAGNGGLDWADVAPMIREAFEQLEGVTVYLFAPTRTRQQIVSSGRIKMTRGRATVLALMDQYAEARAEVEPLSGKGLSHLEIQKLLYFADCVDPSLKLAYSQGRYGPYSDRARHLVLDMEGNFVSGFGDGADRVLDLRPIVPTERGRSELVHLLESAPDAVTHLVDRVMSIVHGYEEPYGLELLASTHWVVTHEQAGCPRKAAEAVRNWTERKGRIFTDRHVERAFRQLEAAGVIPAVS
ncbi:type II toxin-antitoxin system antitoxin DNA ADP-ribosyl glycohydrolase DarG [Mycobacterium vicinigordonae]|uniref:Macro domain-containing protein n=1 Tax=Mycobacterium vicinigordonae TaxID=1719132 RepID=A0A7D6IAL9_9MYCO|nr:macro domain-containing protein [Mycobacterium vicinigordonae]QLL08857.1 macro domain-containing protein [Mycobacterium vicinigordonae]